MIEVEDYDHGKSLIDILKKSIIIFCNYIWGHQVKIKSPSCSR